MAGSRLKLANEIAEAHCPASWGGEGRNDNLTRGSGPSMYIDGVKRSSQTANHGSIRRPIELQKRDRNSIHSNMICL